MSNQQESQTNITAVQETTETNTIILIMLSVSDVLTDSVTKIKTGTKYVVFMNGTC